MCVIVDANVAREFVPASEDAAPIIKRLTEGDLRIVIGHQLKDELLRCSFRKIYRQLVLSGRIQEVPYAKVDKELRALDRKQLSSDDPHVIALAKASGARILFSKDQNLHADFKKKELIDSPRGKIYQSKDHENLLDTVPCHCD